MSGPTWNNVDEPDVAMPSGMDWLRVVLRGLPLALLVFGCLALLLLLRLIERPLFGLKRPITPWITVFVCRNALRLLGIPLRVSGTPITGNGAIVANHSSWLDIFSLNARTPLYFVSKSEVARWPGIGWLARATGTVFIQRDRQYAQAQTKLFQERLLAGHKLLFFPEGTSTDGLQILPFKTTLFQSFLTDDLKTKIAIQPVSVVYHAPERQEPRFYGWWGDMDFATHLLRTLATPKQGSISIQYHDPLPVSAYPNRKALAAACEAAVRQGHTTLLQARETGLQ